MIIYKSARDIIEKNLYGIFFSSPLFIEVVEFCKTENDFEYIETIKKDVKYKELIENVFGCISNQIDSLFIPCAICYEKYSYNEDNEQLLFYFFITIKHNNTMIDLRIEYDYENESMIFEEYEF